MREVTLLELEEMVEDQRAEIWDVAQGNGREPKIYLHWTAGRPFSTFDDYHINITGDGKIFVSTDDMSDVKSHTYHRNSGSIGIAVCCAYDATTNDLGEYPPSSEQIETLAKVVDVVASALWLTINKKYVMTHGEAADNEDGLNAHEDYGPRTTCERWDLEFLGTPESPSFAPWDENGERGGDVIRGKANWYHQQRG